MENSRKTTLPRLGFLLTVLLFGFIACGLYYLLRPGTLPIRQVRVIGQFTYLVPNHIQAIVSDEVRGGFFNMNMDAIFTRLIADPWIQDVQVKRIWPDIIQLTVVEQRPVAYWNGVFLLNQHGLPFSPKPDMFFAGLPELYGVSGEEKKVLDTFIEINNRFRPIGCQVKRLSLSERRSWEAWLDNGVRLIIGRADFDQRLGRFIALGQAGEVGRLVDMEYIDLRYPNGFVVRWTPRQITESG